MKVLFVFLLTITISFSQNVEPFQRQFMLNDSSQYLNSENPYFQSSRFTLGWHWGDQAKITSALLMNQTDVDSKSTKESVPDSTLLFIRAILKIGAIDYDLWTHCNFDNHPVFGKSLCYDPTLYIDPDDVYKLHIREEDPQNPVFGFLHRRGRVLNDPLNVNYSRLIIEGDSLIDEVVLSDPWPNNMMYCLQVL